MPPSSTIHVDILEVARHFEEQLEYHPGALVCLERKGRPWLVTSLITTDAYTITTVSGHVYDRVSGVRVSPECAFRSIVRPLTRERLDYLLVREFLSQAEKLKMRDLPFTHVARLVPIAESLLEWRRELSTLSWR